MIHGASRLLTILVAAAAASGCASYPWEKTTLYVNSGTALYREKKMVQGNQVALGYKHPIDLPLEKTVLVLSQLVYRHDPLLGKAQTLHIFTDDEIRGLAEPMSLALAAITPDERLRFLVIRSSWTDVIAGARGTSGVAFRSPEGILHFAFDRIHEQFQVVEGGDPNQAPIATEPTTLTKATPIIPGPGMQLHVEPKVGKYPRWIEIANIDDVKPPAPPVEVAKPAAEPPKAIVIPTRPQVSEPDAPSAAPPPAAAPPPPTAAAAPAAAGQPAPAGAADEAKYQRVRSRLEQLKRLRQDGVLTEEEYQKEYQKALSEL